MPRPSSLTRGIDNAKKRKEAASDPRISLVENSNPNRRRSGRVLVGGHFAPEVQTQLRVIAAENRTTIQMLLAEGINMMFARYGKPEVAEFTPND